MHGLAVYQEIVFRGKHLQSSLNAGFLCHDIVLLQMVQFLFPLLWLVGFLKQIGAGILVKKSSTAS